MNDPIKCITTNKILPIHKRAWVFRAKGHSDDMTYMMAKGMMIKQKGKTRRNPHQLAAVKWDLFRNQSYPH